jgi:acetyl esterase/lipase
MTPIAIPDQPSAIEIGTGPLPGAENPESWHSQYGSRFARNVTVATITPFLPEAAKASGAAVVVAPGGGFRTLSMENEGWNVARALAERGVAAFVLKYRLNQTPADMAGLERSMAEMFSGTARRPPRPDPQQMITGLGPQIADSRAAFALIRRRAAEWRIDPDRIGMVGFSAGAMLTMATALVGEDARPAFIGNIYGPLAPVTVPTAAVRAGRSRLRHVPQGDDEHRLVRCLRELADDARDGQAQGLIKRPRPARQPGGR